MTSWGWGTSDGIVALIWRGTKESPPSVPTKWGHSGKVVKNKPERDVSPKLNHIGTLISIRLPVSRTMRNKFMLFKQCSLWYFVMAAHADYDTPQGKNYLNKNPWNDSISSKGSISRKLYNTKETITFTHFWDLNLKKEGRGYFGRNIASSSFWVLRQQNLYQYLD